MTTAALAAAAATHTADAAANSPDTTMRAVVATGYGKAADVLTLTTVPRPTPKANELLVRVCATNVTSADTMMRRGTPAFARLFLGLTKPGAAIPGTGVAGVVEAVGANVTSFKPGDEVFGESGLGFGAHAEYVCVPADGVILPKPAGMSYDDAIAIADGPMTSFNFLRRMANVQPGDKVLINGASGALGTAAVQLAHAFGAEVTGVCSTANVDLVRSLGADHVIDYTKEDFTAQRDRYDVIYDTVGKSSFRRCRKALTRTGSYLSPVLGLGLLWQMMWTRMFGRKRARFDATGLRPPADLRGFLTQLIAMWEAGTLRSVIERTYRLDEIHAAHEHVDSGRKKGTIIVHPAS
ncbi:MAG: NAD(P)-dependent alcohol dehydrogenase [Planctomycetota bacterium]